MPEVTLGGERLGSGKKNKVYLREYERSSHNLGYVWRSTMAAGTLVPFMAEPALPGDSFEINLECDIKTHPTIGPLFGTYKVQLDVFIAPIRLYQGKLHMNMLNIGMNMAEIKLPQLELYGDRIDITKAIDNQQINSSSIFSYLNIRGVGAPNYDETASPPERQFNAISYLAYWDIYKNYYANKQEEVGAVIHTTVEPFAGTVTMRLYWDTTNYQTLPQDPAGTEQVNPWSDITYLAVTITSVLLQGNEAERISLPIMRNPAQWEILPITEIFQTITYDLVAGTITAASPIFTGMIGTQNYILDRRPIIENQKPQIKTFPLSNIDDMRQDILSSVGLSTAFTITSASIEPYSLPMERYQDPITFRWSRSMMANQEGLALKTYQSDLFNNWLNTEWIDGENGITEITSIDTTSGSITIDEISLSRKIYNMLNRIAISGGSYDDWMDSVYTHERTRSMESPMYMGGLIKELHFQEVVSNSEAGGQPLGTLAGRGVLGNKDKGGHVKVRVDEPSYIIGIISLTPRIDYSQGNKWDVNLKTMDDFHKPALDEIGFQELITDQMAWWDTAITHEDIYAPRFKSAGKQPAWINYMTNVNQVRGNFAEENEQMFMVLNRRYDEEYVTEGGVKVPRIKDLTTYIDPSKFNHVFADTRIDAQNFWAQIGVNIQARRKMSAKVIPNL